jgi:hypothetical protein
MPASSPLPPNRPADSAPRAQPSSVESQRQANPAEGVLRSAKITHQRVREAQRRPYVLEPDVFVGRVRA